MKQWQKYVAEALGTFILVFGGSLAILTYRGGSGVDIIVVGFGFGLSLLAGLYAFGEVSGGHFNPAISLAMFLDRRLTAVETVWYWISQFVGAILASLVVLILFASSDDVGKTANVSSSDARNFFVEIIMTAIFIAVVLQVTRSGKYGASTLIAIPLTLAGIHFATIGIDSTGVNPARSFGPVLLSGKHWADIWLFILGPAIGGVVGWAAHMVTVRGDTTLTDDLTRAATDMRGVEMGDIRQGPGQVPEPGTPPASPPEA
jgi:aquaporin Z